MNGRGFSLVELMVVMVIIGIILGISSLNFSQMSRKSSAETTLRELYSDIKSAQMDSLRTYRRHEITFNAGSYVIRRFQSAADTTGTVVLQKTIRNPVTTSSAVPVKLRFSEKSYPTVRQTNDTLVAGGVPFAVCFSSNDAGAAVDSIVVSEGTINLALKRQGGSCAPADCDLK